MFPPIQHKNPFWPDNIQKWVNELRDMLYDKQPPSNLHTLDELLQFSISYEQKRIKDKEDNLARYKEKSEKAAYLEGLSLGQKTRNKIHDFIEYINKYYW
jgi:phage terminase large subunit-like protein